MKECCADLKQRDLLMNFHPSARVGRILLQGQRYERKCRLVPKISKEIKTLQNLQFLQSRKELPKIPQLTVCASGLFSPRPPSPPIRSKNPSTQRHSQVDPGVPQHQVRVPCPGPNLTSAKLGGGNSSIPTPKSLQHKSVRAESCRGWRNICPSKEVGLVWNASQGKAPSDQLQLQQQLLLAEENSPAQELWVLLNCPSQVCLLWFSPPVERLFHAVGAVNPRQPSTCAPLPYPAPD